MPPPIYPPLDLRRWISAGGQLIARAVRSLLPKIKVSDNAASALVERI
jgi:hypothetical protein